MEFNYSSWAGYGATVGKCTRVPGYKYKNFIAKTVCQYEWKGLGRLGRATRKEDKIEWSACILKLAARARRH